MPWLKAKKRLFLSSALFAHSLWWWQCQPLQHAICILSNSIVVRHFSLCALPDCVGLVLERKKKQCLYSLYTLCYHPLVRVIAVHTKEWGPKVCLDPRQKDTVDGLFMWHLVHCCCCCSTFYSSLFLSQAGTLWLTSTDTMSPAERDCLEEKRDSREDKRRRDKAQWPVVACCTSKSISLHTLTRDTFTESANLWPF